MLAARRSRPLQQPLQQQQQQQQQILYDTRERPAEARSRSAGIYHRDKTVGNRRNRDVKSALAGGCG